MGVKAVFSLLVLLAVAALVSEADARVSTVFLPDEVCSPSRIGVAVYETTVTNEESFFIGGVTMDITIETQGELIINGLRYDSEVGVRSSTGLRGYEDNVVRPIVHYGTNRVEGAPYEMKVRYCTEGPQEIFFDPPFLEPQIELQNAEKSSFMERLSTFLRFETFF